MPTTEKILPGDLALVQQAIKPYPNLAGSTGLIAAETNLAMHDLIVLAREEAAAEAQAKLDAITQLFWRLDNTMMTHVTFRRMVHEVHGEIPDIR